MYRLTVTLRDLGGGTMGPPPLRYASGLLVVQFCGKVGKRSFSTFPQKGLDDLGMVCYLY